MYIVDKSNKFDLIETNIFLDGYTLHSKNKSFSIGGIKILNINIINKKMAYPFVSKVVKKKYNKLIELLTELMVSDDDTGGSIFEVLNMIEKFKQEVKNKYRKYLKRKELEEMAEKLIFFQKQAKKKEMELRKYFNNSKKNNHAK